MKIANYPANLEEELLHDIATLAEEKYPEFAIPYLKIEMIFQKR